MPINFPNSPTDGQLYAVDNTTYYYDSVYNVWLTSLVPPQENKALSNSANTANAGYLNANAAFDKANSANVLAYNTGIAANNYAGFMANSANAYAASLTPDLSPAFNKANDAFTVASASFDKANSANVLAYNTGIGANNYAGVMANSANGYATAIVDANLVTARAYTNTSTTAANNYAGVMANSANGYAASLTPDLSPAFNKANDAFTSANQAGTVANSANTYADSTYVKKSGDTITGDLTIQGNLTTSGVVTYANTQTLLIGDSLITLNNDIPAAVAPSEDSGIEVKRGSSANVALLWNEGSDRWTFTNDGTNYRQIASNTDIESANNYAGTMANAANAYAASLTPDLSPAFNKANSAYTVANAAFDKANNSGVNVSTTGPTNNTSGTLWFNSNLGRLFVYYTDVDSSQWVEASPSSGSVDVGLLQAYTNAAADLAVLSYNQSNTAFNTINVVFGVTNAAFGIANVGNAAFGVTNAAFGVTNTSFGVANAAFNTANNRLANSTVTLAGTLTTTGAVVDSKGDTRDIPPTDITSSMPYALTISDTGKMVVANGNTASTANIFVPNAVFSIGNTIMILNQSTTNVTITQNSSVTMFLAGNAAASGNRTLAGKGIATLICVGANNFIISGAGLT